MLKRHLVTALAVVLVLAAMALAIGGGMTLSKSTAEQVGTSNGVASEFSAAVAVGGEASDYFQRHPEVIRPEQAVDLTDYFQRHLNRTITVGGAASDWHERHPEALNPAVTVE